MKPLTLSIVYDHDVQNPLEHTDWKVVSFSNRHNNYEDPYNYLKDTAPEGKDIGIRRKLEVGTMFILSCYQHGSTQWGLQGEVCQCRFDTAQVAGLLIYEGDPKDIPKDFDEREKMARSLIKTYTQWANGEVYGYCLDSENDHIDSCWGFYEKESMLEHILPYTEGKAVIVEGEASYLLDIKDLKALELINT